MIKYQKGPWRIDESEPCFWDDGTPIKGMDCETGEMVQAFDIDISSSDSYGHITIYQIEMDGWAEGHTKLIAGVPIMYRALLHVAFISKDKAVSKIVGDTLKGLEKPERN